MPGIEQADNPGRDFSIDVSSELSLGKVTKGQAKEGRESYSVTAKIGGTAYTITVETAEGSGFDANSVTNLVREIGEKAIKTLGDQRKSVEWSESKTSIKDLTEEHDLSPFDPKNKHKNIAEAVNKVEEAFRKHFRISGDSSQKPKAPQHQDEGQSRLPQGLQLSVQRIKTEEQPPQPKKSDASSSEESVEPPPPPEPQPAPEQPPPPPADLQPNAGPPPPPPPEPQPPPAQPSSSPDLRPPPPPQESQPQPPPPAAAAPSSHPEESQPSARSSLAEQVQEGRKKLKKPVQKSEDSRGGYVDVGHAEIVNRRRAIKGKEIDPDDLSPNMEEELVKKVRSEEKLEDNPIYRAINDNLPIKLSNEVLNIEIDDYNNLPNKVKDAFEKIDGALTFLSEQRNNEEFD